MARDYFIQTTSLVPPRGVSVEMTEIRPLRPNQAIILPGVAVLGQGLKFEVRYILFLITITSIKSLESLPISAYNFFTDFLPALLLVTSM